jgi:nicotinamide-nucleotide amidase
MFLNHLFMYDIEVINSIKDNLISCKETLAIAESVTSGHLQAAFSIATMATEFYQGGTTTYNLAQKVKLLHIDPIHALSCNCVSEKVAGEMSLGVAKLFQSDWGIAITGYAAPVPEMGIKELFAYWAVCHHGEVKKVEELKGVKGEPLKAQLAYTNQVLKEFLRVLKSVRQ